MNNTNALIPIKTAITLFVVLLLAPLSVLQAKETLPSKPNVLLIVADDLGLQLSCYGDKHIRTPNLDALAASGTRFKTAYITQASCSPSRASIFTGLFPHTHGHIGLAKPKNPPLREQYHGQTLPTLMKAAGYRTGIIGKLHVHPRKAFKFDLNRNADLGPNGAREVREMARVAGDFMTEDSSKPFFLMMSYVDPHHPFAAQMDGMPEKPTRRGEVPAWPFQQVEDDTVLEAAANYYNCVRRLDAGVGMLMENLKAAGKDENTLIIFLGDHGPPFTRAKTTCYEAGLRVPFIVRWQGVTKAGLASDAFVSSVDILPTILDATGLAIPPHVQGRSLRKVAAGDNAGWRTTLAGEFHQHGERPFFPRRALRDSRYQVIHNLLAGKLEINIGMDGDTAREVAQTDAYRGTPAQKAMALQANPPEWELYDLDADPGEFHNLSADPAHAETLRRMQSLLLEWRKETHDPFLDPATLAEKHAEVNMTGAPTRKPDTVAVPAVNRSEEHQPSAAEVIAAVRQQAPLHHARNRAAAINHNARTLQDWIKGGWGRSTATLSALYENTRVEEANQLLREDAQAYLELHASGGLVTEINGTETRLPWGNWFGLSDYVRILGLFGRESRFSPGRIAATTEARMKEVLWIYVSEQSKIAHCLQRAGYLTSLGTENHDHMQRINYYLAAEIFAADPDFSALKYADGFSAAKHVEEEGAYLKYWIRTRATSGMWTEVGSDGYAKYSYPPLFNLSDLSEDEALRKLATMFLDLCFIEEAQMSFNGRRWGGRSRAYCGKSSFESYKNTLYGETRGPASTSHSKVLDTSSYQVPDAAILLRHRLVAHTWPVIIENRVLGELFEVTTSDSSDPASYLDNDSLLVNYACRGNGYAIGSTQSDPSNGRSDGSLKYKGGSCQNRMCGILFENPEARFPRLNPDRTRAENELCAIFPAVKKVNPEGGRPQNSFWTAQHRNALLLQRLTGPRNSSGLGSYNTSDIGVKFFGQGLNKVERDGWIFAENGTAYGAVKFLDDAYEWQEDGETAMPSPQSGLGRILFHAGDQATHGGFSEFQSHILSNHLAVTSTRVTYSFQEGASPKQTLQVDRLDPRNPSGFQLPQINGAPLQLSPAKALSSPWLNTDFGSSIVEMTVGPILQRYDFGRAAVTDL